MNIIEAMRECYGTKHLGAHPKDVIAVHTSFPYSVTFRPGKIDDEWIEYATEALKDQSTLCMIECREKFR